MTRGKCKKVCLFLQKKVLYVEDIQTHRESDAHCCRKGAGDELSLVELHQQRRLPNSTVPDKDGLQENRKQV